MMLMSPVRVFRCFPWFNAVSLVPACGLALELGLGDLDCFEEAPRLVDGFLELGAGIAVVDDAAAGLDIGLLALDHQGPQCDAGSHVAGEIDVTDVARVRPALRAVVPL